MNAVPPQPDAGAAGSTVTLNMLPERHLIRCSGSYRHILFTIHADERIGNRPPIRLALVLDRSGSMQGEKLTIAKQAAETVLDRLDERDQAALVIFDAEIDTLQQLAPVTAHMKAMVHEYLSKVDARSTTALYEGWLTGCKAIAAKEVGALKDMVSHCFLLTDGQANVGESDPEQIANKAAEVRRVTNISTSTFGIGDYEAGLLHPMAVAGGGHYHYLRAAGEIASAFNGSTLDLLKVAVPGAWLELEFGPGVTADVVSGSRHTGEGEPGSWKEWLGDLLGGDERRLVVRFSFPRGGIGGTQMVRARLHWQDAGAEQVGPWQELVFTYADGTACDAELARRDCEVMRWVGLHHADRARIEATTRFEKGDEQGAKEILRRVARRIREYAGDDPALLGKIKELEEDEYRLRDKNVRYTASRDLRGSRDHRAGPPATS